MNSRLTPAKRRIIIIATVFLTITLTSPGPEAGELRYGPFSPGTLLSAIDGNPSLLALAAPPHTAIRLPFPLSLRFTFVNNSLLLPSPIPLFDRRKSAASHCAGILSRSFDLKGLTPDQVSERIVSRLKSGIDVESAISLPVIAYARHHEGSRPWGWGVSGSFHSHLESHLPSDLFALLFSPTEGLQKGNTLSFERFHAFFESYSQLNFTLSRGTKRDFRSSGESAAAWGVTLTCRIGHALAEMTTQRAAIIYTGDNTLRIDGRGSVTTAGPAIDYNHPAAILANPSLTVAGFGTGISLGWTRRSTHGALCITLQDLGVMVWKKNLRTVTTTLSSDSISIVQLRTKKITSLMTSTDDTSTISRIIPFKTSISIAWNHPFFFRSATASGVPRTYPMVQLQAGFKEYLLTSAGKPALTTPIGDIGLETLFLKAHLPVRVGWSFQDTKRYSSYGEIETVSGWMGISLFYRATDLLFRARHGTEVGFSSHIFR